MSHYAASRASTILLCSLCFGALACEQKHADEAPPAPPVAAPVTASAPAKPALEAPVPSAEELPIAEDFEAEAEQTIDDSSYKQALAELAGEIDAETSK